MTTRPDPQGAINTGDLAAQFVSRRLGKVQPTKASLALLFQHDLADGQLWFVEEDGSTWEYRAASTAPVSDDAFAPGFGVGMFIRASGSVRKAAPVPLADIDATILITSGKRRFMPAATLSANRTLTLSATNAVLGDEMTIVRQDVTANTLAVANGGSGGGTISTMPASKHGFLDVYFDGTNWLYLRAGTN